MMIDGTPNRPKAIFTKRTLLGSSANRTLITMKDMYVEDVAVTRKKQLLIKIDTLW